MISNSTSYTFFALSPREILIIFQTWERPDMYFKDLVLELRKYILDADLYFDLLVNNGPNDRFYSANLEKGELIFNSFKKVNISKEYSKIADEFFIKHWDIIENNSVLTPVQKTFFKKRIQFSNLIK